MVHPQDELLPLKWQELGLHLLGHVRTSGRTRYRFARNTDGKWCVILQSSTTGEPVVSPWCEDQKTAEQWLKKRKR